MWSLEQTCNASKQEGGILCPKQNLRISFPAINIGGAKCTYSDTILSLLIKMMGEADNLSYSSPGSGMEGNRKGTHSLQN